LSLAHPPLTVAFTLAAPEHATLKILDKAGHYVVQPFDGDLQAGPQTLTWDGSKRIGKLLDGSYQAVVVLAEPTGAVSHTLPFVAASTPPTLTLLSEQGNQLRFRLGEDATVALTVDARTYVRPAKAGIVAFWLRTLPQHFAATATDAAGNVSPPTG